MATEYSRTILTVSMLGGDPSAFGTRPDGTAIDLLNDGVWNFAGELGAQGLNGLIFALLAVDAGTYPEPERAKNTRAGSWRPSARRRSRTAASASFPAPRRQT